MAHPISWRDFDSSPKLLLENQEQGYGLNYFDPTKRTAEVRVTCPGTYEAAKVAARNLAHRMKAIVIDITREAKERRGAEASPYARRILQDIESMTTEDLRTLLAG